MATTTPEDLPQKGTNGVAFSQRLWSEEVAIAASQGGAPLTGPEPGYEFSNGRRFNTPTPPIG